MKTREQRENRSDKRELGGISDIDGNHGGREVTRRDERSTQETSGCIFDVYGREREYERK